LTRTELHEVRCACGAIVSVRCAEAVDVSQAPDARQAVLDRILHTFRCDGCDTAIVVDTRFLYIDLDRKEFFGVHPEEARADELARGKALVAAWHQALGDRAPLAVRSLFGTEEFLVRLCFGLEELREKLVAHDAGLDDLGLELFKARVLADHPDLGERGVQTLRLDHVEPDGRLAFHLELATRPTRPAAPIGILVARDGYDALAARPWRELIADHPWVARGPHVSLLRLTLPGVAPP
jgi:hypothetical protein